MPKSTLEFLLPEDRVDFNEAIRGADAFSALREFKELLRSELKYKETPMSAEELKDAFYDILNGHGLLNYL